MSTLFTDQSERDYLHEQEAAQQRDHLRLVHGVYAGGEEAADAEVDKLALDFGETMDSLNFILARLGTTTEKPPDFSLRVRDFLDAVIGATGGSLDFVEVTDEEIAARMGCSEKTAQRARNELRSWPSHTKLVEIKEHWRDAETLESHPHSYRCHVTRAAAESTVDARLAPQYRKDRGGAFKEAARVTADSMKGFIARPAKRRRQKPESELLLGDVEQAVKKLESATARQPYARNIDYERLEEVRAKLVQALADFDAAYDFAPDVSMHIEEERSMDTEEPPAPDVPSDEGRVETFKNTRVDNLSTQNDSTESITYDFDPEPPEWPEEEGYSPPEYDFGFADAAEERRLNNFAKGVNHGDI